MKKIFTLLAVLFGVISANAQVTSSPREQSKEGSSKEFEIVCKAFVYNNTQDTIITWKRIINDLETGWTSAICDNVTCYDVAVGRASLEVAVGDSTIMDAHFYPQSVGGTGTVRVAVWAGSDSANADTLTYSIDAWTVGLKEEVKEKELNVYPNPATSDLTLEFASESTVKVEIYNVLGKKLKSTTHQGRQSKISVGDLTPGVYIIRVYENDRTYSRTFRKSN